MVICYWIEWEGYPETHDYIWEPYKHLHDSVRAHQLLVKFHQENPEKLWHPEFKNEDGDNEMEGREHLFPTHGKNLNKECNAFLLRSNMPRKRFIPYSFRDKTY